MPEPAPGGSRRRSRSRSRSRRSTPKGPLQRWRRRLQGLQRQAPSLLIGALAIVAALWVFNQQTNQPPPGPPPELAP